MVGRPTRRTGRGRVAHSEVQGGQEANPEVQEGSGGPPVGLGVVRMPIRRFERGR